jgi:hypothetical protein
MQHGLRVGFTLRLGDGDEGVMLGGAAVPGASALGSLLSPYGGPGGADTAARFFVLRARADLARTLP